MLNNQKRNWFIIIVVIFVFVLMFGLVLYLTENEVGYSIELKDNDVPIGNNVTLKYKITKGYFENHVNNVLFIACLVDNYNHKICDFARISIDGLNEQSEVKGSVVVPTWNLSEGIYTIKTYIDVSTTHDRYGWRLQHDITLY